MKNISFRATIMQNSAILLIFFWQKYNESSGISVIFISRKIRAFCYFFMHNFRAKMYPPKLTELLRLYVCYLHSVFFVKLPSHSHDTNYKLNCNYTTASDLAYDGIIYR